jgi:hypothetical protein
MLEEKVEVEIKKSYNMYLRVLIFIVVIAIGALFSYYQYVTEEFFVAKIVTIFGLCFGLHAACYLSMGLWVSDQKIEKSAMTLPGHNPTLMALMMMNRRDGILGIVCLFIGFFLQFVGVILT